MKRAILTLLVASLAIVGCKRDNAPEPTPVPTPEDVIQLASGMQASVAYGAMLTKTGVRDEKGFKVSDHIGVSAIYSKDATAGTTDDAPDLSVARWFANKPATAEAAVGTPDPDPTSWYNPFHWGEGATSIPSDGASVPGDYQFYPQGRYIFLFAYYPMAKGTTGDGANGVEFVPGVVAADNTATHDQVKVTLQAEDLNTGVAADGTVSEPAKVLTLKQPDVMVGANAKRHVAVDPDPAKIASVNRKSPITDVQLNFQHVLAQLRLKIRRSNDVKEEPILKKVEIIWPKAATYDVREIATTPQGIPLEATLEEDANHNKMYAAADRITHTIACSVAIPAVGDGTVKAADILGEPNKEMLMLHPLTSDQLKGCLIKITVKFPSIANDKVFPIYLTALTDGIVQGKCNVVTFLVNYVKIDLTGSIAAWGAGETGDLVID